MKLQRFFVLIVWRSGSELAYCAGAEDEAAAVATVLGGRPPGAVDDVVGTFAAAWPSELPGPRVKLDDGKPRAFRLGSRQLIAETRTALGCEPGAVNGPIPPPAAPGPGLARTRPPGLPSRPWRNEGR
jgi:hypothetical protein